MKKGTPGRATAPVDPRDVLGEPQFNTYVAMLKALGHPVRLRIVDLIYQHGGEICACEFEHHFDLKQPTISHHLKILREAGLIRSRQNGSWVHNSIEPAAFTRLKQLMEMISVVTEKP